MEIGTADKAKRKGPFKSNRCGMEMVVLDSLDQVEYSNRTVAEWKSQGLQRSLPYWPFKSNRCGMEILEAKSLSL